MNEIVERIVEKYDLLIHELQEADSKFRQYLTNASETKNVSAAEVDEVMKLARHNKRRLETAIAERNLVESYLK